SCRATPQHKSFGRGHLKRPVGNASRSALPTTALAIEPGAGRRCHETVFTIHFVTFTAPVAASSVVEPPAMPGMLRKSRAFELRYYKFESISLQRRVRELSVPERVPLGCRMVDPAQVIGRADLDLVNGGLAPPSRA